ncbi:MAG: hypothetical protein LBP87_04250 [Planctomycetaceae bacterium]|jgi:hypothetical protein|nr:hypothetical protein [Planctomycetaceae bacterium]
MYFYKAGLTNADVANYLKDSHYFTEEQINAAILTGGRYGLEITADNPIDLFDFLDVINYPQDLEFQKCIRCITPVVQRLIKNDPDYGIWDVSYLLYSLLGISSLDLTFKEITSKRIDIIMSGTISISWSFFNRIYNDG